MVGQMMLTRLMESRDDLAPTCSGPNGWNNSIKEQLHLLVILSLKRVVLIPAPSAFTLKLVS